MLRAKFKGQFRTDLVQLHCQFIEYLLSVLFEVKESGFVCLEPMPEDPLLGFLTFGATQRGKSQDRHEQYR